jgi:hypothetical protein
LAHHEYRVVFTDGYSVGFDPRTGLAHKRHQHADQMQSEEQYRKLDADTLELTESIIDPQYYSRPFGSNRRIWKVIRDVEGTGRPDLPRAFRRVQIQ